MFSLRPLRKTPRTLRFNWRTAPAVAQRTRVRPISHFPHIQMADCQQTNGRQAQDKFAPPSPFLLRRFGIFSAADGDTPNSFQALPKSYTKPFKTAAEQRQKNTRSRAELVLDLSWICFGSVLDQSRSGPEQMSKRSRRAPEEMILPAEGFPEKRCFQRVDRRNWLVSRRNRI